MGIWMRSYVGQLDFLDSPMVDISRLMCVTFGHEAGCEFEVGDGEEREDWDKDQEVDLRR